jgi:hypothetical protein
VSEQAVQPDGLAGPAPTSSAQARMQRSDSTRYLCAGAYLDAEFRDAALQELLGQKDRAVAPAYTTDAVPIVRHALNARHRQVVRDAVLTGILALLLVLEGRNLLAFVAIGFAFLWAARALRALVSLRFATAVALLLSALVAVLVATMLLESNSSLFSSLTGSNSYDAPSSLTSFAGLAVGIFVVFLGGAWAAIIIERLVNRQTILDELTPTKFAPNASPPEPPAHQARITYIAQAQTGNVTYYPSTATDRPFVGAGEPGTPWTLAVPLVPAEDVTDRISMTTESLQDAVSLALARMQGPDDLSIQGRLVTPGTLKTNDGLLDPANGLPRPRISHREMRRLAEAETTGTNYYLCVRMAPRKGAYEIWVFLRSEVQAQTLYLELIGSCVAPVRAAYRDIDEYAAPDQMVILRTALGALLDLPGLLLRAPLRLLRLAFGANPQTHDFRSMLRNLVATSRADHGAHAGVRELGVESEDFLGALATQRHINLIERQVIETIAASMEQSGFVADEFRRRAQTILDGSVR